MGTVGGGGMGTGRAGGVEWGAAGAAVGLGVMGLPWGVGVWSSPVFYHVLSHIEGFSMVVILKVGGRSDAAERIRANLRQDGLDWRLVHVSSCAQAVLALRRERVDLLLAHHNLPDGTVHDVLAVAGALPVILTLAPGDEAAAAQALDQGVVGCVFEALTPGFAALVLALVRAALRQRDMSIQLERQHRLLMAVSRAQSSFIRTAHSRQAFDLLLTELLGLTGSSYGFVGEVFYDSPTEPWLNIHAINNLAWDDASRKRFAQAQTDGLSYRRLDSLFGEVLRTGQPVVSNQPKSDPRAGGVALGHAPLSAFLGIPVGQPGHLLAMVGLANKPGGYNQADIDFLSPLLDAVAQLVEARRQAQQGKETRATLETTLDSIDQGISMVNPQGRVVVFNRQAAQMLDLDADWIKQRPLEGEVLALAKARGDFGPDCERIADPVMREFLQTGQHKEPLPARYQRVTPTGRWLEVHQSALADGTRVRTYTDVTHLLQSQQALHQAHTRLEAILDGTGAGTWEWTIATDEVSLNARFAALLGHAPGTLPNHRNALHSLLMHPEDDEREVHAAHAHLVGEHGGYECQYRMRHQQGHWVWLLARGRINQRAADGSPVVMSGTAIDITASKHAEEALRVASELLKERSQTLESTLFAMGQGLLVVGADGRIRAFNPQVVRMLDVPEGMLANAPSFTDLVNWQTWRGDFGDGCEWVETSARGYVADGGVGTGDAVPSKYVRRNRHGRILEVKSDPLPGGGFVRTFSDVTSYVEAVDLARNSREEVLRLNETLEQRVALRTAELESSMHDIEALSYCIAHDLRGPLRAVNGFAALITIDEAHRLSPDGLELFHRITDASRRMGTMITDLLELFKVVRANITPVSVDVAALVHEAVRSLASSFPASAVDVEPMPAAPGDATLLRHLVFNLVDNALKYSAKVQAPATPLVTVGWSGAESAWFVRDNGVGFDMAQADKLFGLFQRLHAPADFDGSGVGLAVVARIVQRHGGRVWAQSAPGQGATFWFTLGPPAGPCVPMEPRIPRV